MSRWFRYYDEALDDPKVQRLPGDLFKFWVNLLCLASRHEGRVPPVEDVAFSLRVTETVAARHLETLAGCGLLDSLEGDVSAPHNWNGRQFKADVSTERVKRFRKRQMKRDETVSETPPDTDTESETDTSSLRSDAPATPDARMTLFRDGLQELAKLSGRPETKLRPMIGKWLRDADDDALRVLTLISKARQDRPAEPISWIEKHLLPSTGPPVRKDVYGQRIS